MARYERWLPIAFFVLGFLFDALTLTRIDDPLVITQQGMYLLLVAFFVGLRLVEAGKQITPPAFLVKAWPYRESVLHFLMGSLLSSYTIFYFKSASAMTSLLFVAGLVALLILNEFKRFQELRIYVGFLSLCLVSYFVALSPVILGFIGYIPFLLANLVSAAGMAGFYHLLVRSRLLTKVSAFALIVKPAAAVQTIFVLLYFLDVIPPVPLSVKYMGIFHAVEKKAGSYHLSYTRSKWRFWENGDQTFAAKPGDTIHCFIQIFSPSRFKDQLQVRWLYYSNGWQSSDAIPISILGGREEGYRAVTKKSNYQPGQWRVQVETLDNKEVGRIDFTVKAAPADAEVDVKTLIL